MFKGKYSPDALSWMEFSCKLETFFSQKLVRWVNDNIPSVKFFSFILLWRQNPLIQCQKQQAKASACKLLVQPLKTLRHANVTKHIWGEFKLIVKLVVKVTPNKNKSPLCAHVSMLTGLKYWWLAGRFSNFQACHVIFLQLQACFVILNHFWYIFLIFLKWVTMDVPHSEVKVKLRFICGSSVYCESHSSLFISSQNNEKPQAAAVLADGVIQTSPTVQVWKKKHSAVHISFKSGKTQLQAHLFQVMKLPKNHFKTLSEVEYYSHAVKTIKAENKRQSR